VETKGRKGTEGMGVKQPQNKFLITAWITMVNDYDVVAVMLVLGLGLDTSSPWPWPSYLKSLALALAL